MARILGAGLTALTPVSALAPVRAMAQTAPDPGASLPTWRLGVTAGGTWYENPRFTTGLTGSSWSTTGRATLGFNHRFRTGTFSLSGFGGRLHYPEISSFDQWTYGGSAGLGWAVSRNGRLSLSQSYTRSNTRRLPEQDEEGLPLPTSGVDSATSNLGFSQRLGRRSLMELDGTFAWRRYDDPALTGGESARGSVLLAREIGRYSSLGLRYGLSQDWLTRDQEQGRVHEATLGINRKPERGVGVDLSGGVAYMERVGKYYPTGSAGLTANSRTTTFAIRYFRGFGLSFGYARQTINDVGSARFAWQPVDRLSFNLGYTYGYRRDPADESFEVRSQVGAAGLSWRVVKGLGVAMGYSYELNRTTGFSEIRGGRATASLSYGVDWK